MRNNCIIEIAVQMQKGWKTFCHTDSIPTTTITTYLPHRGKAQSYVSSDNSLILEVIVFMSNQSQRQLIHINRNMHVCMNLIYQVQRVVASLPLFNRLLKCNKLTMITQ